MQTSIGAFDAYTRSNHSKDKLQMANLSIPQTSGIYKITCTANGKLYVGSSVNIQRRWFDHRVGLRRGVHHNLHLQNAWNKYGEQSFTFEIIELVMPWSIIDREQYWLDALKPYDHAIGFNIATCARPSRSGSKLSEHELKTLSIRMMGNKYTLGYKHTPESKENMRRGRKNRTKESFSPEELKRIGDINRGKNLPKETREKISQANKGRKPTPEQLEKIRTALAKRKGVKRSAEICAKISAGKGSKYIATNPDGVDIEVVNLSRFCRDNGLSYNSMTQIAYGKYSYHNGWKCRKA